MVACTQSPMRIDSLYLKNFRNYAEQRISFHTSCNVICGENAQGKTNLLEAIACLSIGKSPRTRIDRELIRFGADAFVIEGIFQSRERDFVTRIEAAAGRKKKMSVNKVAAKTASDLSSVLNTVFFTPEDLYLIREGASQRRRFMDASLCQLRPRYSAALAEYHRLWEHKTRILRDCEEHPDLLEILPDFNLRMAQTGAILIHYRARFAKLLSEYAEISHAECSGGREHLAIQYQTVRTVVDPFADEETIVTWLIDHQRSHAAAEQAVGQCLSGPHKDDLEVTLNGLCAKSYASQGQTRTAALSMKLAAREIHREILGEYPVLLLDDVLSELDPRRQEFVLNRLANGQVFISCCEEDRLHTLLNGSVFHISGGQISLSGGI